MLLDGYGHYMPTESAGFADALTAPNARTAPPRGTIGRTPMFSAVTPVGTTTGTCIQASLATTLFTNPPNASLREGVDLKRPRPPPWFWPVPPPWGTHLVIRTSETDPTREGNIFHISTQGFPHFEEPRTGSVS